MTSSHSDAARAANAPQPSTATGPAAAPRLNSAQALGDWLRHELAQAEPDSIHAIRVITQEIDRWFKSGLGDNEILAVAHNPADTGSPQWNALLEGVVSYRLHERGLVSPDWTRRTRLDIGWSPHATVVTDARWRILDVFSTPAEILERGVIFPRQDLARL